jgi:hypothetical protein
MKSSRYGSAFPDGDGVFFVGRAVHTATLRCPASLADQPRLPVAAFGVYASPLCSPGGELARGPNSSSGSRAKSAWIRVLGV